MIRLLPRESYSLRQNSDFSLTKKLSGGIIFRENKKEVNYMGADIVFYIQKKNDKDKWEDIELFTKDNKRVEIFRCGWDTLNMLQETWGVTGITGEDVEETFLKEIKREIINRIVVTSFTRGSSL